MGAPARPGRAWLLALWALTMLAVGLTEDEVVLLQEQSMERVSSGLQSRQMLHGAATGGRSLGEAVDENLILKKEEAQAVLRTRQRAMDEAIAKLRQSRSVAPVRDSEAKVEQQAFQAAKQLYSEQLDESKGANAALESAQAIAAKESQRTAAEISRYRQAVIHANEKVRLAQKQLQEVSEQAQATAKTRQRAIELAETRLQQTGLNVTLRSEHRVFAKGSAQKAQMEASTASLRSGDVLADFAQAQRAREVELEQRVLAAQQQLDAKKSNAQFSHEKLEQDSKAARQAAETAALLGQGVHRTTSKEEARTEEADKRASAGRVQQQQDVAAAGVAQSRQSQASLSLKEATDTKDEAQRQLQKAQAGLWEVKKLKLDAELLDKKVSLGKRQLHTAERTKKSLSAELSRQLALESVAQGAQALAQQAVDKATREDADMVKALEASRQQLQAGIRHAKEQELAAEQASSAEASQISKLEQVARGMKKHRVLQLEQAKSEMRNSVNGAQARATTAQMQLRIATEADAKASRKLQGVEAALLQAKHEQRMSELAAERTAREESAKVKDKALQEQADFQSDASARLEAVIAAQHVKIRAASDDEANAKSLVDAANQKIADAAALRAQQIGQAKALAVQEVSTFKAQKEATKARDERQVKEMLDKAKKSGEEASSSADPEERAAATAKLQAYAESAQQMASSDGMEMKRDAQEVEIQTQQIQDVEHDSIEAAKRDEGRTVAQARRTIADAKLTLDAARRRNQEAQEAIAQAKHAAAEAKRKQVGESQAEAKRLLGLVNSNLEASKRGLVGSLNEAQQVVLAAQTHRKQTKQAVKLAQEAATKQKEFHQNHQRDNIQNLRQAHASLTKADDEASSKLMVEKGKLGDVVSMARQKASEAQNAIEGLRQELSNARALKYGSLEAVKTAEKELTFHQEAGQSATSLIEATKTRLLDAKQKVKQLEQQLKDTEKQADEAQKKASGDFTSIELQHERAETQYQAALKNFGDVHARYIDAETTHASKAAVSVESRRQATNNERVATEQRLKATRVIGVVQSKFHQASEESNQAAATVQTASEAERAAAESADTAQVQYHAAAQALVSFRQHFEASLATKEQEVEKAQKQLQSKADEALKARDAAVRAADQAALRNMQAASAVKQSKREANGSEQLEQAKKAAAQQEVDLAREAAVRAEGQLDAVKQTAAEIRRVQQRKVDAADTEHQREGYEAKRAQRAMQDANFQMLAAQHKSLLADNELEDTQGAANDRKAELRAAQRSADYANQELQKAKDSVSISKQAVVHEQIQEAKLRASNTARDRDHAEDDAEGAESRLPRLLAESRDQATERTAKAKKRHVDRLQTVTRRADEVMALATKKAEFATAAQIQAEMAAEKAQSQAEHTTKKSQSQIDSVRVSAEQAVVLAKRRVAAAQEKRKALEDALVVARDQLEGVQAKTSGLVSEKTAAEGNERLATQQLESTRTEQSLALQQKEAQVSDANEAQRSTHEQLLHTEQDLANWESDTKKAQQHAAAVKLKLKETRLKQSEVAAEAQFETNTARSRSVADAKAALTAAQIVEEDAQLKLQAATRKYAWQLRIARSEASAKAGQADEAAAIEIQSQSAAAEVEIQSEEFRQEAALQRYQHAISSLGEAQEARLEAVRQKQTYEQQEKRHARAVIEIERMTKTHEVDSKKQEMEADRKHRAKIHRMELDQKAVDKARAEERNAKEKYSKSTKAPTERPTPAPTGTPSLAPSNAPTSAPTIPLPCTTPDPTANPTAAPTAANTTGLIFDDLDALAEKSAAVPSNASEAVIDANVTDVGNGTNATSSEEDEEEELNIETPESDQAEEEEQLPEIAIANASDVNGSNLTNASDTENSNLTNASDTEGFNLTNASDTENSNLTNASDTEGFNLTNASDTENSNLTNASDIEGFNLTNASDTENSNLTNASDTGGFNLTNASDTENSNLTNASDTGGFNLTNDTDSNLTNASDVNVTSNLTNNTDSEEGSASNGTNMTSSSSNGTNATVAESSNSSHQTVGVNTTAAANTTGSNSSENVTNTTSNISNSTNSSDQADDSDVSSLGTDLSFDVDDLDLSIIDA